MNALGKRIEQVAHDPKSLAVMGAVKRAHAGHRLCHHKVRALYALREAAGQNISSYLEIGVHNGTSMSYVLLCDSQIRAVGIDLFERTNYADRLALRDIKRRLDSLNKFGHSVRLIKGDSHDSGTYAELGQSKFDLIFIDGDHSYEGVKNDFGRILGLLSPGGIVAFDDNNDAQTNRGVRKFVLELVGSGLYDTYDFVDRWHPGTFKNGITFLRQRV
jgi:predicted O-methyltransferase YrrM